MSVFGRIREAISSGSPQEYECQNCGAGFDLQRQVCSNCGSYRIDQIAWDDE